MQTTQAPKITEGYIAESHADNSVAGLFVGSGFSLFGFLLLIVLLA